MSNETRTMHNFVAAVSPDQVTIEPARTDLVRRQDVVQVVDRMIDGYMTQQGALLDQVQGETTRSGFLSGADQVRERRRTSGMYLSYYVGVTGLVAGGLVLLAHGAGYLDAGGSFATWLAITGGLALWLGYRRHGDEFKHSPEGIARHVIDAHWDVASYESETRRKAIEWEHDAEARRQAAQERAAEHGRQLAQLRVDELAERRKAIEAQTERRAFTDWRTEPVQTLQDGAGQAQTALQVQSVDDDREAPTTGATGDTGGAGWQAALLQWVAGLYSTPGALTDDGIIRQRAPWAARSSWLEGDKAQAKRVCCTLRPALIEPAAGGQWRLRREMFTDADQALQILSPRLS